MKRQMKIAAVVSATALLAIGASFTSMAAAKTGTWNPEDGSYRCYDKNGDYYEYEFCYDGAKEYYVGEDGYLVRNSWVEYDGDMYYICSDGSKLVNDWKLMTPYEDEEADEEWYYFGANGKRVEDAKKVIAGKTYYFDGYGKMLTGWVNTSADDNYEPAETSDDIADVVFCDETGARVEKSWIYTYAPGVDVEEDDLDNYSEAWYYVKSLGKAVVGKQSSVDGVPYIFNNEGRMLEGWVANTEDGYVSAVNDDGKTLGDFIAEGADIYYTCEVDGHVKKNQWVKDYANTNWESDPDLGTYWYYIQKDGKVLAPTESDATIQSVTSVVLTSSSNASSFVDGVLEPDDVIGYALLKTIGEEKYLFNRDGQMLSGLKYINGDLYYFGGSNDGAMKIGAQTIADSYGDEYKFFFGTEDNSEKNYKKGVGVTGNANGKLYIGGLLATANEDYKYKVYEINVDADAKLEQFVVNRNGSIQTSKNDYKDDGIVIIEVSKDANDKSTVEFETSLGADKGSVKTGSVNQLY